MADDTLSVVLFSGTDDRLHVAATLIAGAAAVGRKVNVFVQFWALEAFRAGRVTDDHGVAGEATESGAAAFRARYADKAHWSELLAQAKEIGDVTIRACSGSSDMLGIGKADLDPLVDEIAGVVVFLSEAPGPVVFV